MKLNIGSVDKKVRIGVAALIVILYFLGIIKGTWAIILGIFAAIMLVTAYMNFCPIWAALGVNTRKKDK